MYAPIFLNLSGPAQVVITIIGVIGISIAFAGALQELATLWKSEALSWFGIGLLPLVPAIILNVVVVFGEAVFFWTTLAKVGILALYAFAGPWFFYGIAAFFKEPSQKLDASADTPEERAESRASKRRDTIVTVLSLMSALLPILSGLFRLVVSYF